MSFTKRLTLEIIIGGICALLALTSPHEAEAKGKYNKTIPNGKVYSCKTCHGKSKKKEDLNPFGKDYMDNKNLWDSVLAKKDSDGDGKTNGWELGDEKGTWKKGDDDPDPGRPIYNPGDKNSKP